MARPTQHRTYPREGSAVASVSNPLVNPPVAPGTRIYSWRFLTPWGWCGGDKNDPDWTTHKDVVLAKFEWCKWRPCELLEDVIR